MYSIGVLGWHSRPGRKALSEVAPALCVRGPTSNAVPESRRRTSTEVPDVPIIEQLRVPSPPDDYNRVRAGAVAQRISSAKNPKRCRTSHGPT